MKENPTAEKQFYKKLTKLIETGVVKFDAEPREVIHWFEKMWQRYTRQSPVTDEQIDEMALKEFPVDMYEDEDINHEFRTGFEIGGKLISDLQPKTDDWIECSERLPSKDTVEFIAELPHRTIHKIGLWAEYKGYVTYWKEKSSYPYHLTPKTDNHENSNSHHII